MPPQPHHVRSDGFTFHGRTFEKGDTIPDVPEAIANAFTDELEPVEQEEPVEFRVIETRGKDS